MRDDLAHLTPEALTQLTNAGLVKRAVRELAAGYRPQIDVDSAQTLLARFDDGVECSWPYGTTIQSARCSCGAAGACRHRLIAALAYREGAAGDPQAAQQPVAPPREVATVSDDDLARAIPAAFVREAQRLLAEGVSVDIRRRASGEPCDTARLPNATVRFWAGGAIESARCDCVAGFGCQHVALAVWAFRMAQAQQGDAASVQVRLGSPRRGHGLDKAAFEQLTQDLLQHGVTQGGSPLAQGITRARAEAAGATWLLQLVIDLEAWAEAFAQRSALYEALEGVSLIAELTLRLAAGNQPGNSTTVLGVGQAGETALDRLRLLSLGARTRRDGERRMTELIMASIDTGTRLVLRHEWRVPEAREADEAALRAGERVAAGVLLEALAHGQLLAQQAVRRADGSIRLARARSSNNSVLPQTGDWSQLAPPLRFSSVSDLLAESVAHPNHALQPRHAARHHVVFTPRSVQGVGYDANEQSVFAALADSNDQMLVLHRTHERHVPHALDAIAGALDGRFGPLRHVAGTLDWRDGTPRLEPWALVCDRVIVPDLAPSCGALSAVPLGRTRDSAGDTCMGALDSLGQHLATALHHGMRRVPPRWRREGLQLAQVLAEAGLRELSDRLRALHTALATEASPSAARGRDFATLAALWQLHIDATQAQRASSLLNEAVA